MNNFERLIVSGIKYLSSEDSCLKNITSASTNNFKLPKISEAKGLPFGLLFS